MPMEPNMPDGVVRWRRGAVRGRLPVPPADPRGVRLPGAEPGARDQIAATRC